MKATGWLIWMVVCIVALMFLWAAHFARAQNGHTHEGAVGRFYQSWVMPDAPKVSCCHDQDCSPAASKFEDGKWYAMRGDEWVVIPDSKIERERDSPDGRSHLCGRPSLSGNGFSVFCFVRGGGA